MYGGNGERRAKLLGGGEVVSAGVAAWLRGPRSPHRHRRGNNTHHYIALHTDTTTAPPVLLQDTYFNTKTSSSIIAHNKKKEARTVTDIIPKKGLKGHYLR